MTIVTISALGDGSPIVGRGRAAAPSRRRSPQQPLLLRTNVDTGRRVWTHAYAKSAHWGPMPATCGGLAFTGGTNGRMFHAFDASTGKLLWEFPTDSGITGQPSSFMVDGRQ